jgi:hypothetical protein
MLCEGVPKDGVSSMLQAQSFYQRPTFERLILWFVIARIGHDLRECYQLPKDLTPTLLAVIRELDATEGKYSLRYAPPLERRSVAESDWLPPRFV